jgi:hypothetical protein
LTKTLDNFLRFLLITPKTKAQPRRTGLPPEGFLLRCQSVSSSTPKESKSLMHPNIPPTIATAPPTRKVEIRSSDANQPQLKFVVKYREAQSASKWLLRPKKVRSSSRGDCPDYLDSNSKQVIQLPGAAPGLADATPVFEIANL